MNNLFLHSENHNSTIFQNVQYNDIQYSNNELTPPNWFTELHANAPQVAQDVGYGSLEMYCEFPVPPHAIAWDKGCGNSSTLGVSQSPQAIGERAFSDSQIYQAKDILDKNIRKKKVSVLEARKGAKGFVFDSAIARGKIKKIIATQSPQFTQIDQDEKTDYSNTARRERYLLQKVVQAIYPDHKRLANCNNSPVDVETGVSLVWDDENKKANMTGRQTCGHGFGCPCCGAKIANDNGEELERAFVECNAKGFTSAMFTATIRHKLSHTLADSLAYLKEIEKVWRNSKPIRKLQKNLARLGDIQALEITYSFVNGWHPHLHILFIFAGEIDVEEFTNTCVHAWLKASNTVIERDNLNRMQREVSPDCLKVTTGNALEKKLNDYLTKNGAEKISFLFGNGSQIKVSKSDPMTQKTLPNGKKGWSASKEMTQGNRKKGRGDSMTPQDFLRNIVAGIDEADIMKYAHLYREFVEATHGHAMLKWSPKLREKIFGAEVEEKTDEEKASDKFENQGIEFLAKLTKTEYKTLNKNNLIPWLLETVERSHIVGDVSWREELTKITTYQIENRIDIFDYGQWRQYDTQLGIIVFLS
jgi:hypothetical protein